MTKMSQQNNDNLGESATNPFSILSQDTIKELQRIADEGLAGPDRHLFQQDMAAIRQILEEAIEGVSNVTDTIENPELLSPKVLQIRQEVLEALQLLHKTTIPRHEINPVPSDENGCAD